MVNCLQKLFAVPSSLGLYKMAQLDKFTYQMYKDKFD